MNLKNLLIFNGILFVALGLAFALYGPLAMGFFEVPELDVTPAVYWHLASFVRMFGAALLGWGFVLWAASRAIADITAEQRRSVVFAQLLACLMGSIIALTQQSAIWLTPAGWAISGLFIFLTLVYAYFLVLRKPRYT